MSEGSEAIQMGWTSPLETAQLKDRLAKAESILREIRGGFPGVRTNSKWTRAWRLAGEYFEASELDRSHKAAIDEILRIEDLLDRTKSEGSDVQKRR